MSASPMDLLRDDLRDFAGYRSARSSRLVGDAWLNANESPWPNPVVGADGLRRYPEPQPTALRAAMAARYGCLPEQVLAGRGSDEGIDLLIRALCRPGADAVVVTPPTFGMYEVCARLHWARVLGVPLEDGDAGFRCDSDAVAETVLAGGAKLVFLCSPGNPGGNLLPLADIDALARRLQGRALVVVDEAYIEFAQAISAVTLVGRHRNVAVLRTLSKAHALAAARVGCVVADAELVAMLQRCQSPYPLAAPCSELACNALGDAAWQATRTRIDAVIEERGRLAHQMAQLPSVARVYPSSANFLLVRFTDARVAMQHLLRAGIVVRDMRAHDGMADALRITVGTPSQNRRVIEAIAAMEVAA
ncbi:histidinol-phosphate aminotransferase [Lysobacter arseniciresistens ZS79]|uniref:Histidinol-phosphate aminotransferase n=1 Tax=Lysobacter arseniciresistens ZS79 TaxID=913325 RepID=A0A0A0EST1_9GAMM|nr:histidinol-phosphate transaminase [Lysobacter arseniciresistens]KGM53275.1 histidinol-phosphate aminotransferase [Lysobacter arseniciresistens ZS79]